jgi:hypothetical protein
MLLITSDIISCLSQLVFSSCLSQLVFSSCLSQLVFSSCLSQLVFFSCLSQLDFSAGDLAWLQSLRWYLLVKFPADLPSFRQSWGFCYSQLSCSLFSTANHSAYICVLITGGTYRSQVTVKSYIKKFTMTLHWILLGVMMFFLNILTSYPHLL